MIFKSPPIIIPFVAIKEALAISSAVSPEAGTTTSFPVLNIELSFDETNVSTLLISVSYLV